MRVIHQNHSRSRKRGGHEPKGQVVLEFTFCVIILLLLIYGCIKAFRWAGVSLADRRIVHENALYNGIDEGWTDYSAGPIRQLNPDFYKPLSVNMVFNGW